MRLDALGSIEAVTAMRISEYCTQITLFRGTGSKIDQTGNRLAPANCLGCGQFMSPSMVIPMALHGAQCAQWYFKRRDMALS